MSLTPQELVRRNAMMQQQQMQGFGGAFSGNGLLGGLLAQTMTTGNANLYVPAWDINIKAEKPKPADRRGDNERWLDSRIAEMLVKL